jgi:monoamine oxidase
MYDVAILGGGIAGLHTAYRILSTHPETKLLLLEKSASLGGRMETHTDRWMTVEAGAGRFSKHHRRLLQLIDELGLSKQVVPIHGESVFMPSASRSRSPSASTYTTRDIRKWIREMQRHSQSVPLATLQRTVFLDYAKQVLGDNDKAHFILDAFGYSTELVVMNAHDALVILSGMMQANSFCVLRGGLSQVVDRLVKRIRKFPHVRILCHKEVVSCRVNHSSAKQTRRNEPRRSIDTEEFTRLVCTDDRVYQTRQCVFALPQPALAKLACFRPLHAWIDQVTCRSLCRIYSVFPPDPTTGKVWFHDLPKVTTDNDLRMIIPIDADKGMVMTSYSDNEWADRWNRVRNVDAKLVRDLTDILGHSVPTPLHTNVFYWKCGVGYWKVGADSRATAKRMIQPFDGRRWFVCGETFSEKNQQWIEGALETSEQVIRRMHLKN